MPYSWCRELRVETQKLSRWSFTILSRHLLLVHCQQRKRVHFVSFTVWAKKCLRIWTWLPLKELMAKGSPASCPRAVMPLGCSSHACQYAVTLLFSVAGSTTPFVTVEADCHQLWGICHCNLLFLRLGIGYLGSWDFCELLNCLSCYCLVLHGLKSLRVEITEHISGPWKLVSKDNIQRG